MKKYILLLLLPILAFANIGKITAIKGDISIKRDTQIIVATTGFNLEKHDLLISKKNSKAQIVFSDKTIFTIGQNSTLDIAEYLYDEKQPSKNKAQFNVLKGAFSSITGRIGKLNKSKFKLKTKSASIGIRGTIVKANQKTIMCTQGLIAVTTLDGKTVEVKAGEKTDVSSGTATPPQAIQNGDMEALDNTNNSTARTGIVNDIQNEQNNQANNTPMSWGTWSSDLTTLDGAPITDASVLDNLRNSSSTVNASYTGQVSGTTSSGGDINLNNNNIVQVDFALGGGKNTVNGTMNFDTQSGQTWAVGFGGTTSGSTFTNTSISGSVNDGSASAITSGEIDGSFYGKHSEAVGGNFDINANDGKSATGIFKATK